MPETTEKPTKEALRAGMKVFFGEHGDKNIGLEEPPALETAPPAEKPPEKKEGEPELGPDGKPVEKAKEPPVEPPAPEPEAKPKRVSKKKPVEPPPTTRVDDETISRVASETAARTAAEMQKKETPSPVPEVQLDGLGLDDEDKEVIAEMQLAGRHNPKFADLADRTLKFWEKEKEYIETWQKKNPDQEYDEKEHKEFYAKHHPDYNVTELKKAVREATTAEIEERVRSKVSAETKGEVAKLRFETRWKDEAPAIDNVANESVAALVGEVDPELAKLLIVGTDVVVSPETLAKIESKDKIVGIVLKREAGYLARMIREIERLDRYPEHYVGDRENPLHITLFNAAVDLENRIASLPKDDQLYDTEAGDNRVFIRQAEFNRKLDAIESSKDSAADKTAARKTLAEKHWTLDASDVKEAVRGLVLRRVKEKIAEYREIAGDAAKSNGTPAPTTAPTSTTTTPPEPPVQQRPKPPSTPSGGGDKTSTIQPAPATTANIQEQVDKVFFR